MVTISKKTRAAAASQRPFRPQIPSHRLPSHRRLRAAAAMATLLQLPNEILLLITDALDTQNLCNLRLASKRMNDFTLPTVFKRCFETRCVMLQQPSLENLVTVSRHPAFGPARKPDSYTLKPKPSITPRPNLQSRTWSSPSTIWRWVAQPKAPDALLLAKTPSWPTMHTVS